MRQNIDCDWAMPSARALMLRTQRLRLFAVPVSIAIALAGCGLRDPYPGDNQTVEMRKVGDDPCAVEASPIQYSTVGDLAESKLLGHGSAQFALNDGFLSKCEYDVLMSIRENDREDGYRADKERILRKWKNHFASGTSGSAQDRNGLDPKGAGPTAAGGDARTPSGRPNTSTQGVNRHG